MGVINKVIGKAELEQFIERVKQPQNPKPWIWGTKSAYEKLAKTGIYTIDGLCYIWINNISVLQVQNYLHSLIDCLIEQGAEIENIKMISLDLLINSIIHNRSPNDVAWAMLQ